MGNAKDIYDFPNIKGIERKIGELSKKIKDYHTKHEVLGDAERINKIESFMGRKIFGVTAGTAKLQQSYARDSVNMSAERNQLLEVKSIYTSSQKSSLNK